MSEEEKLQELLTRFYNNNDAPYPVHFLCQEMYSETNKRLKLTHDEMNYLPLLLVEEGLLDPSKVIVGEYQITIKGMKALKNGGYLKYIKEKRDEEEKDRKHRVSVRKKDYWLSMMAPWQVFLFWPLFVIAIIGAAVNVDKAKALFSKQQVKVATTKEPETLEGKQPYIQPETDTLKNE